MQSQQGSASLVAWAVLAFQTAMTHDLLLSVQVHLGWSEHLVTGFVSISCSKLTFISAVADLV